LPRKTARPLGRVIIEINLVCLGNNLAVIVAAARRADVVGAFQLTTAGAFIWIASGQRVMRTALVAARAGHSVLGDSHVSTSVLLGASRSRLTKQGQPIVTFQISVTFFSPKGNL
jgi:hypothetical protein